MVWAGHGDTCFNDCFISLSFFTNENSNVSFKAWTAFAALFDQSSASILMLFRSDYMGFRSDMLVSS